MKYEVPHPITATRSPARGNPGAFARLATRRQPAGATAEDAIRALVSLGYSLADAERGVRSALDAASGPLTTPELIRAALPRASAR